MAKRAEKPKKKKYLLIVLFLQTFQVKRRWDEDVVFKNCARSEPDKKKNEFINDSLRSEFHRKFMEKYVK